MDQTNSDFSFSGFLQGLATTAGGVLNRYVDIELQAHQIKAQQQAQAPAIASTQQPIVNYAPNQGTLTLNTGTILPLLLVGLVAVLVLKD